MKKQIVKIVSVDPSPKEKPFSFRWYIDLIIRCAEKSVDYQHMTPFNHIKGEFYKVDRYDILLEFILKRFYEKYEK